MRVTCEFHATVRDAVGEKRIEREVSEGTTVRALLDQLDAELRAINAHILFPVGDRPLRYALEHHTSLLRKVAVDAADHHATGIRGRGFLVVPVKEPTAWTDADRAALVEKITALLDGDYRQTKGVATTVG